MRKKHKSFFLRYKRRIMKELKERIKNGWQISAVGFTGVVKRDYEPQRKSAWLNTILENAPSKDKLKILDVGTGPGFFANILSEAGHDVTGIDLSENMIEEAKKNAKDFGVEPRFICMDIQHPNLPDNTFDLIVSRNVVWSLSEPRETYENWLRILKPGGRVIVFDGDHLKDLREPEKYGKSKFDLEKYKEKYIEMYGEEPKCSYTKDTYEVARGWRVGLPLAKEKRPQWDAENCIDVGFREIYVNINVNDKVLGDERDREMSKNSPFFMLVATK